jgi:hypothetical protein
MSKIKWIVIGLLTWVMVSSVLSYYMFKDHVPQILGTTLVDTLNKSDSVETKILDVNGTDYLMVESKSGVGITFAATEKNTKKLKKIINDATEKCDVERAVKNVDRVYKDAMHHLESLSKLKF